MNSAFPPPIITLSGDASGSGTTAIAATVTKTGGVAFAASATSDTTNAANIVSGALPVGRVSAISLSSFAVPTGDLPIGSHKLTGVTDPTNPQDSATKNYVDTAVAALAPKNDCQAATTTALAAATYNNGSSGVGATLTLTVAAVLVLDGYTPGIGDRLLIKNQASAVQNGIYTLTTVGVALGANAVLTRSTDFNQPSDGINGALVYVLNGTTNGNTLWSCTTDATLVFGTTNINWSQFTGTTYTADETTLHLAGTTFSIKSGYLAASATTDTTNAANITSGVLPIARVPSTIVIAGCTLTGVAFKSVTQLNLSSGQTDVYTCPSNKRAFVLQKIIAVPSATTAYDSIKVSGTYYQITISSSTVNSFNSGANNGSSIILEAAEILSTNTNVNGCNIWWTIIEFDNTCPLKTVKLLSLSSGANTVYTVPAAKSAFVLASVGTGVTPILTGYGAIHYANTSGGTRTVSANAVPSGGSVGSTNLLAPAVTVANNNINASAGIICPGTLNTGDFLNLNTDAATATQIAWVNVIEF